VRLAIDRPRRLSQVLAGLAELCARAPLRDGFLGLRSHVLRDPEISEIRITFRSGTSERAKCLLDRHAVSSGKLERVPPVGAVDPLRVYGLRPLPDGLPDKRTA
jgi:hypothetical protein